jgi:hypothetical protein
MVTHPIAVSFFLTREETRDYHSMEEGTILTARYKGTEYTATVREGGRVEWNGTVYNSISACAKAICGGKSVNGYVFFGRTRTARPNNPTTALFRLVKQLADLGYQSHNGGRCGFHVHVSRAAFGEYGQIDNPRFFAFKSLVNGALFRRLSQRETFHYCTQKYVTVENFARNTGDRYCAVNITAKTVEVRIFRGNLREERLRKNIEAVIAALEFSQQATDYTPPTDEAFSAFVEANRARFPNLASYIRPVVVPQDQ